MIGPRIDAGIWAAWDEIGNLVGLGVDERAAIEEARTGVAGAIHVAAVHVRQDGPPRKVGRLVLKRPSLRDDESDQGTPPTVADVEAAAVEDAFGCEELTISIPRDTAECLEALYGADWRAKVTHHIQGSLEDSLDTLDELAQTLAAGRN